MYLRFKSGYPKISQKLVKRYLRTIIGEDPPMDDFSSDDDAMTMDGKGQFASEKKLAETVKVCQSMHMVLPPAPGDDGTSACFECELNPAKLTCTCKGFRMIGLCSHVIVVTALYIPNMYSLDYIENLVETIATKRAPQRPKKARKGSQMQPDSDNDEEADDEEAGDEHQGEGEDEDLDEDLDRM